MSYASIPVLFATANPNQPMGWPQVVVFALIISIFYVLILLPMKRRQKKIQEFQRALKAGDKVVTVGGIYGQITRVNDSDNIVQLQIADRVRIDVARASVAGFQGQEPVVSADGGNL